MQLLFSYCSVVLVGSKVALVVFSLVWLFFGCMHGPIASYILSDFKWFLVGFSGS